MSASTIASVTEPVDAVVVGGGPAGITAATWLARYRRSVVVLDSSEYRNRWVDRVHGYLGSDPVAPSDLLERGREQLARYESVEFISSRATEVRSEDEEFVVTTENGSVRARRIVLACGVVDEFPDIPGFFEHYGADVVHCPACDAYEARDRPVVAIGWSEHVAGFALGLLNWASAVTVVTEGRAFEGDARHRSALREAGIEVCEEAVSELHGSRGALRSLEIEGGREIPCEMAFFSIAHRPRTELATALGCELTEEGYVRVDEECATTVAGVWAAGDVTPGDQLVQVAAAEGAVAGIACARSLVPNDP